MAARANLSAAVAIASLSTLAPGCAHPASETVPSPPAITSASLAVDLDDPQVATIAEDLRNGLDERARLAVERASDPRVRDFAKRALADDPGVEVQLMSLGPRSSILADQVTNATSASTEELAALSGADFDARFVDDEARALDEAITILDRRLVPTSQNAQLAANLGAMRAKLAAERVALDAISPRPRPPAPSSR
jgi:putative membrane protein